MEPLDRTLVICILLAAGAFLTATPALGASAAGLLGLAVVFSLIPTARNARGQRRLNAKRIIEGGETETSMSAHGASLVPGLFRVRDQAPEIAEATELPEPSIRWGSFELAEETALVLPVPGSAEVGPLSLERMDPLALSSSEVELARAEVLYVWPSARDARDNPLRARYERILAGDHKVRNPGSSHEFYGIREYQPGDAQRDINWKATIRQREMMVTQYQHETHGEFNVFVDNRRVTRAGTLRANPAHAVLRSAATLGELAAGQRDILRVYAFGDQDPHTFRPQPGGSWLDQYFDWLSELTPTGNEDASVVFDEVLPRMTPRSMVVFVTPFLGDEAPLGEAPLRAAALENSVMVIATPLPSGLPEPMLEEMRAQRRAGVQRARKFGVEILDMEKEPSLLDALAVRSGMQ